MLNFSVFLYSNNKKVSHLKITFKAVFGFGDARIQNRGISRRVFFVVTISLSLESREESCIKMFQEEDFLDAFLFHQHKVYSTIFNELQNMIPCFLLLTGKNLYCRKKKIEFDVTR